MLWFIIKVQLLLFVFIWLRGTLPRVRYDQFMKLGWKVLIPVSMVWLMLVAAVRALRNENYDFTKIVLYVGGAVLAVLLLSLVVDVFRDRARQAAREGGGRWRRRTAVRPDGRRLPRTAAAGTAGCRGCRAGPAARSAPARRRSRRPARRPGPARRPTTPSGPENTEDGDA